MQGRGTRLNAGGLQPDARLSRNYRSGAVGHGRWRGGLWAAASATAYSFSSVIGKSLVLALGAMFGVLVLVGFIALERIDASVYIVLVYLFPAFIMVGSAVLGERHGLGTWLALLVVMGRRGAHRPGAVQLCRRRQCGQVHDGDWPSRALRRIHDHRKPSRASLDRRGGQCGMDNARGDAGAGAGSAGERTQVAAATALGVRVVLFALVPTVAAITCFFRALRYLSPTAVAMVLTVEVALVILWSVFFLDERASAIKLIGAGVVMAGVLLAQWLSARTAPAPVAAAAVSPTMKNSRSLSALELFTSSVHITQSGN